MQVHCSCCGKSYPRAKVHQLHADTPVYICRRCGWYVATRLRKDHAEA